MQNLVNTKITQYHFYYIRGKLQGKRRNGMVEKKYEMKKGY
jgi:hypothetical protein